MEFIIPVRFTGTRCYHLSKPTLDEAVEEAKHKAYVAASFEIGLTDTQTDVLSPRLMLTDEQLRDWPYWAYGYTGTDGVDWRVHYTKDGRASIPDFAEQSYPVPPDWIDSWKEPGIKGDPLEAPRASVKKLMADNDHNLREDPSDTYAKGYQDALKDALAALGGPDDGKRFD